MFDLQHALNIRGWLDPEEAQWLYDRACTMQSVIEIGSWCGRSTYCLLSGCKGPVYAVDTFEGSRLEPEWVKYAREHGVYDQFILNVGGFPNLHVMHMRSDIAVAMLPVVDMVFIDGSHAYEDVKADIYMYTDKAAKLLCGHDYTNPNCGVKAAVDEAFQSVQRFDTIWYIEKGV